MRLDASQPAYYTDVARQNATVLGTLARASAFADGHQWSLTQGLTHPEAPRKAVFMQ